MNFEAYSDRLALLHKYCFDHNPKKVLQKQSQIVNESMQMKSVRKTKFGGLNDKRFYFHDGIAPLPFRLSLLEKTREEKEKQK